MKFYYFSMNKLKDKVCKKVLKKVAKKYDGAEDFTNNIIDEIYSQEKLSAEEAIYFLVGFFQFMFPCLPFNSKIVI